ncbi:L,D-peptidoglycan transpeptidase YkuD (ErfK/YbiS/YcfS/YnhG family) [Rhodopseudomonas julia]|uniref:L,D-peptidoglycan transpeptidase YkuD (ErfK/YbiS/YcfS/YnhG family) n=1 Tax=Rhodopseudomonas julia TaxID=200617 RepID=A0ABU0C4K0_9BRAD|nr:L,D-transpeptidase family protein [Rhodopseudomonas julia]MDQ0325438.1 L,D-peptidoglycan transpeptidase YkuD (ErfK/YbiS/YcfS/YnhG family) [Rhodopseudomonas julia]
MASAPIYVRPLPGPPHAALLTFRGITLRCAIGRSGVTHAKQKREGDGKSPIGRYGLEWCALRPDRRPPMPRPQLATIVLRQSDGWCDEPTSSAYNRAVRLPVSISTETMWRPDGLYDAVIGLSHNTAPRQRRMGSAIFFHLARPGLQGTEGCVAIPRAAMRRILPFLSEKTQMVILAPADAGRPKHV